jgi:hypothetical protein
MTLSDCFASRAATQACNCVANIESASDTSWDVLSKVASIENRGQCQNDDQKWFRDTFNRGDTSVVRGLHSIQNKFVLAVEVGPYWIVVRIEL